MRSEALREPSHRVSPRARLVWLVSNLIGVVVLALVWTVVLVVFDPAWLPAWPGWLLLAALFLLAMLVPVWRYRVHRWEVSDIAAYTQTGWWAIERRIAPISRVQTVDYAQGPLERLFGLASVTITTASAAGALRIAGLDRDTAVDITQQLTAAADAAPGDAT